MSNIINMLETLAVSTQTESAKEAEIGQLAAQHQLSAELTEAIRNADLAGVVQLAAAPGRGCFIIVSPDEPEQPDDEDGPDDDKQTRIH